jgi:hypothetical protein
VKVPETWDWYVDRFRDWLDQITETGKYRAARYWGTSVLWGASVVWGGSLDGTSVLWGHLGRMEQLLRLRIRRSLVQTRRLG